MPSTLRHRLSSLVAVGAALAQLWLGTLHASPLAATYCGDGSSGRSVALLQQLPPELRLPLERLDGSPTADCELCALACAAALPSAVAVAEPATLRPVVPAVAGTPSSPRAPRLALPPVRGPPATR